MRNKDNETVQYGTCMYGMHGMADAVGIFVILLLKEFRRNVCPIQYGQ